jgi:hypothetical protein
MDRRIRFTYGLGSWCAENIDHCIANLQKHQDARNAVRQEYPVYCNITVQPNGPLGVSMRGEPSMLEQAVQRYYSIAGKSQRPPYDDTPRRLKHTP